MKRFILISILLIISLYSLSQISSQINEKQKLLDLLGQFPERPELKTDTIEKTRLENGWRYKIKYLSENADNNLNLPEDWIYAYLFVPDHKPGEKLPAIIAIHQDDVHFHIGKDEPAGLNGDTSMYYGIELYDRGYVVICPDRYYHAERRLFGKNPWFDFSEPDYNRDYMLWDYRVGTLLMKGQSNYMKEAYDGSRAVDFLYTLGFVDKSKIGAIGHSAGGVAMFYLLFYDDRINLGVSSCGIFDIKRAFDYKLVQPYPALMSFPNIVKEGFSTFDYMKYVYPRNILLTRGMYEWGKDDEDSEAFVTEAHKFREYYRSQGNKGDIKVIVFDENGGGHIFPENVKKEVYNWIDEKLKN